MIFKAETAVEFERRIAMIHFQVNDGHTEFLRLLPEKFQSMSSDALPAMSAAHEELVYPGASASIFQAVIERHDDVADFCAI